MFSIYFYNLFLLRGITKKKQHKKKKDSFLVVLYRAKLWKPTTCFSIFFSSQDAHSPVSGTLYPKNPLLTQPVRILARDRVVAKAQSSLGSWHTATQQGFFQVRDYQEIFLALVALPLPSHIFSPRGCYQVSQRITVVCDAAYDIY